jgi:hypothetical protein
MQQFSLYPFVSSPFYLTITGTFDRQDPLLSISYILEGDLAYVIIPTISHSPSRQDELWKTTCFEFFLGIKHSPCYWEFNLSPTGNWNVYRFSDYRRGMQTETAISALPFEVQQTANMLKLDLQFDGAAIGVIDQAVEIAISTVVEDTQGRISYWALTHSGTEADFHDRQGFLIKYQSGYQSGTLDAKQENRIRTF